jgi:proline racemase
MTSSAGKEAIIPQIGGLASLDAASSWLLKDRMAQAGFHCADENLTVRDIFGTT